MPDHIPARPRPIPTTGRMATRMGVAEQARLKAALQPWLITPEFLASSNPLEIELGIGNGLALYARAAANPQWNFIGSEIYLNGLRTLTNQLRRQPLPNLRIYPEDGRTLFSKGILQPASVTRALILFPDPWPKSGHHKRRIIQPEVLSSITAALKPGGELWVVTDWPSYAYHAIANLFNTPGLHIAPSHLAAADCKPSARLSEREDNLIGPQLLMQAPTWWAVTKYQEKAAIAGRTPWFIKALKV